MAVSIPYYQINDMSLWEIKQRAYFYGQKIVSDRIYMRDAHLSAISISHRTKDYNGPKDPFEEHLLANVYIHDKPFDRYVKAQRGLVDQRGRLIENMR